LTALAGWLLLKTDGTSPEQTPSSTIQHETVEQPREPLVCASCNQEVSDTGAIFTVASERATRVFANPYGHLHEIMTLLYAHSVTVVGPPTTAFTWYPGYAWEVTYCGQCKTHLGWSFGAMAPDAEPSRFWGLLKKALVQGS